jgi:flagellar biogenesis protein FliO
MGISLFYFVKKDIEKNLTPRFFLKYFALILSLVVINIIIISVVQILLSEDDFSVSLLFSEYFLFYLFQKSPIYTLGYIAITIILFLNYSKELLQIEVAQLVDIKDSNEKLYRELSASIGDKTSILTIKIGNKRKVIPVDTITWLEADDYCVKVHALQTPSYTMRSSLKALQDKLGSNFLRVHRNGIVNMNMIKEFNIGSTPNLILTNNHKVLISKSNLRAVRDFLEN